VRCTAGGQQRYGRIAPCYYAVEGKIKGTVGAGRLFIFGVDVVKTTLVNRLSRNTGVRFSNSLPKVFNWPVSGLQVIRSQ
jgi:hypothetical protein